MEKEFTDKEFLNLQEIVIAHSMKVDVLVQLLIDKGNFTKEEFSEKLKSTREDYNK